MNVQNVQQWAKMFKEGRTNTHDEKQEGWPCLEIDEMYVRDDNYRLTVTDLHCEVAVHFTHELAIEQSNIH